MRKGFSGILILLALATAGCGTAGGSSPAAAPPATDLGPSTYARYAAFNSSNAVFSPTSPFAVSWTTHVPEPIQQIAVANGRVVAVGDGNAQKVYAMDMKTGKILWETGLNNVIMTTPVVVNGRIFVGTGNEQWVNAAPTFNPTATNLVRGTGGNEIAALSEQTGRVLWTIPTRGENMPSFVYDKGVVYVANGGDHVYAIDAASGKVLWKLGIGSYVSMSSPALSQGLLVFGSAHPYRMLAVNVHTRKVQWATRIPGVVGGLDDTSPAVAGGRVFTEVAIGHLHHPTSESIALDLKTGAILWSQVVGKGGLPTDMEIGSPTVADGMVFMGNPINNTLVAFDPKTGTPRWQTLLAGGIKSSPVVVGNHLYIGDMTGMLYNLDARTGQVLAARYIGGVFAADYPVVVGQTLFMPNESGWVTALPLSDLTASSVQAPPPMQLPSGAFGAAVRAGQALFMSTSLSTTGLSCNSCHVAGGTGIGFHAGGLVPPLAGVAATFPQFKKGKVVTLDGQINHCLTGAMKGAPLPVDSTKLAELNLYLRWLSQGKPVHLTPQPPELIHSATSGGCG